MLRRLDRVLWIGPVAFFLAACAWAMLDAEYASDTWIGLAAGRHIMERLDWGRFYETFPRQDVFSYTFFQQPWFNQNWLSNLGYYWVYDRLGPSAVVTGTWAMVVCIHVLVLLAVYWRTESWLAAWLAAALVGIGGRDFLEPRSATVGLLCMAVLLALICAIEGQRDRRRWWPIVPLLPLLWFWSNVHGGFVIGYGVLALYCTHWIAIRMSGIRTLAASGRQILVIALVLVLTAAIHLALTPFGFESFAHPGKLVSSATFRSVSEFLPAYSNVGDRFPPMWRFWWILGLTGISVTALWLAGRSAVRSDPREAPARDAAQLSLFDLALIAGFLLMTLWARRFAPLLYMAAAPVLAILVIRLAQPLIPRLRGYGGPALKLAAAVAALVTGSLTWAVAHRELVKPYADRSTIGLLDRARGGRMTHEVLPFVQENKLGVKLFSEYGDAALVMFYAPSARVFIDPRSDQLYTEEHLARYATVMNPGTPVHKLQSILNGTGTDAVLVKAGARMTALQRMLVGSPDWVLVFRSPGYHLFFRRDSDAARRLTELTRNGRVWLPPRSTVITQ